MNTTYSNTPSNMPPQTPDSVAMELERAPLSIPKEIWTLVDNLVDTRSGGNSPSASVGIPESDIFLQEAVPAAWAEVLTAIDNGATQLAYREDSIATCLLQLLAALPEPILTEKSYTACCTAMRRRNAGTLVDALQILPNENRNLFYYITAFLGECARIWQEDDVYDVARTFARRTALLARIESDEGRGGAVRESEREKTELLLFVIQEYVSGRLVPEMVVDLTGSIIVEEVGRYREGEEKGKKGVKKWKKKTGKRMKKVFKMQQEGEDAARRR